MDKRERGKYFERIARHHLEAHSLVFIAENFHCRWGEIDLVMRDRASLVFIEVRFRGAGSYLSGVVSIDTKKQKKLCKTAQHYLATKAPANIPARFDVIAISQNSDQPPEIEWIKNAFECNA